MEFVGYSVGWEAYDPSEERLSAIKSFNMPAKPSITDIRSWFGLVNQLATINGNSTSDGTIQGFAEKAHY